MVERSGALDSVFAAVSDPTRRAILARLQSGEMTVSEIAAPYEMSLHAVSKHIRVLESAGLVERDIRGREHFCRIDARPLREAASWIDHYREFWEQRLEALERHVMARRKKKEKK